MITRSRRLSLKLVYQVTHKNDDLPVEAPPFEHRLDRLEPFLSSSSPGKGAFAPEPLFEPMFHSETCNTESASSRKRYNF
jgi:hypothetical protein